MIESLTVNSAVRPLTIRWGDVQVARKLDDIPPLPLGEGRSDGPVQRLVIAAIAFAAFASGLYGATPNPVPTAANLATPERKIQGTNREPIALVSHIRQLTREQANTGVSVKIRGVVTWAKPQWGNLFVQDQTGGIGAWPWVPGSTAKTGDLVELEGITEQTGFGPAIKPTKVTVLGKGELPQPLSHSLTYMMTGRDDAQWVEVQGVVRRSNSPSVPIMTDEGQVSAWIDDIGQTPVETYVDAEVRVRGVCMPTWNDHKQIIGIRLATIKAHVDVLKPPPANPFSIPYTAISSLMVYDPAAATTSARSHRVKVKGVVSGLGDSVIFLQDQTSAARVERDGWSLPVQVGNEIEVAGFASSVGYSPLLVETVMWKTGSTQSLVPVLAGEKELFSGALDCRLVKTSGRVVGSEKRGKRHVIQFQVDHRIVRVFVPSTNAPAKLGSVVELVAVCSVSGTGPASNFQEYPTLVDLYLNSTKDITILKQPPWWTLRHTVTVIGLLIAAVVGTLAWVSILEKRVHARTSDLKREIAERIRIEAEMEATHQKLLDVSRQAGMAEVATSVLHNVGNVLNSVNVSATVISDKLRESRISKINRVSGMLRDHQDDLPAFLTTDAQGRQIPQYLEKLSHHLAEERDSTLSEVSALVRNVEHIKDIVSMQQSYALVAGVRETVPVVDLVEHSLKMCASAMERHQVLITRDFQATPTVTVEKHKVLQILVNLIQNAKYACDESGSPNREVRIEVKMNVPLAEGGRKAEGNVQIIVRDNGVGIAPENLTRIFEHGFTTRKNGHGFGLHSAAIAARELQGSLRVTSGGLGCGATFVLEFPCQPLDKQS